MRYQTRPVEVDVACWLPKRREAVQEVREILDLAQADYSLSVRSLGRTRLVINPDSDQPTEVSSGTWFVWDDLELELLNDVDLQERFEPVPERRHGGGVTNVARGANGGTLIQAGNLGEIRLGKE